VILRRIQPWCWLLALGIAWTARGAGPYGTDNGWAVQNDGSILLTASVAAKLSQAEVGWVRVEMRLFGSHTTWDSTILGYYDTAVNNARSAGLQVLMLIDGGSWPGSQTDWTQNNSENNPGANGDNPYVEGYATNAVVPIVQHFHDRVKCYELWNEPNCWTSNPSPGVYAGATFIYPSNYGWLLTRSWEAVHVAQQIKDVTLFSGGLFGLSAFGQNYSSAGGQYLDDTYNTGTNATTGGSFAHTKANYNAYPLDGVGQHLYISQGGLVSSNLFRQYEDWVRQAYTKYEGNNTTKKTIITEFAWQTTNSANANGVSQAVQDTNLVTAFSAIKATPYLQMAIWFSLEDSTAAGLYYGVLDTTGASKQSYPDFQRAERFEGIYANGTTNSGILNYFNGLHQAVLGNPYDNGQDAWVYAFLNGYAQDCDGGSHLKLTLMSSTNGTFEVNDLHGFWSFYNTNNGAVAYGYATTNAYAFASGTRQDFSRGYLTWDAVNQVVWHAGNLVPAPPSGLQALALNGEVDLQWNAVPAAASYNVKRFTTNGGPYAIVTSVVGSPLFADGGVNNNTTYYYVVSAVNSYGESDNSAPANATPDASMGNLPSPWQAADIGNVGLTGGAGYSGGRFTVKGSGADIGSTNDAFNFTSQPFNGDGALIARVKTQQNTDPWAKAGVMFRETLATNAAYAMALLTPTNGSHFEARTATAGSSIDVTGPAVTAPWWVRIMRDGNTFTASVSSNGVNFVQVGATSITMATNVFVGFAVCSHTTNALSMATFDNVTITTPPPAPTGLVASSGDGQVSLAWLATAGAGGYNVKRALASNGPFTNVANGLTLTNYVDLGLTNGITYYYVVSAANNGGEGPNSASASALPGLPAPPTGLQAIAFNGEVDLQWNTVSTATSYNVKRSTTSGGSYSILTSVVGTPVFADGSVANNTTYYYMISAVNSYGEGSNSAPANATPDAGMSLLPAPWQQADIGSVNLTGGAGYSNGRFTTKGSGADIGSTSDAFNFTSQPWSGDGAIIARLRTQQNTDPWAKAGVMFRETLASNSTYAMVLLTPTNGSHLQARTITGGGAADMAGPVVAATYWLKLVRNGSTFSASTSSNGVNYVQVGTTNITMTSNVFVGFAVCSHASNALSTAVFDNVTVTAPPVITSQPASVAAVPGGGAAFSVLAGGTPPLGYQWQTNGVAVAGATNATLNLAHVQAADFAPYTVVLSNPGGSVLSAVASLTPAVSPAIGSPGFASGACTFSFPTELGPAYLVEYKYSLDDPSWLVLTNVPGTGAPVTITDNDLANPAKFYRIQVQ
jgi:regulation of enolase protein 1 (concanavalin A-like superfamily)